MTSLVRADDQLGSGTEFVQGHHVGILIDEVQISEDRPWDIQGVCRPIGHERENLRQTVTKRSIAGGVHGEQVILGQGDTVASRVFLDVALLLVKRLPAVPAWRRWCGCVDARESEERTHPCSILSSAGCLMCHVSSFHEV